MAILVGKKAPEFKASAVVNGHEIVNEFSLEQYLGKKDVVFFFYPMDFTFVCPTELFAFQDKLKEFEKKGVALVAASTDTEQSHWAWLNTPKNKGGIQGVTYPIVADTNKTIAQAYDVLTGDYYIDDEGDLASDAPSLVAYRGLFIIDKDGIVQHQTVNNLPLGRSVDEALRMVDAIQFVREHGEVCPANWHSGKEALKPSHEGTADYLSKH